MGYLLKLFTGNPLTMLWIALGIAAVAGASGGAAAWKVQGWRLDAVKNEFAAFVSNVEVEGEKAKVRKIEKESKDAKTIAAAVSDRDAALKRLRLAQAGAGRGSVSLAPPAAAGSREICFEPEAFASAIDRFRERVTGIVIQGEEAAIDAQALLEGWPKP